LQQNEEIGDRRKGPLAGVRIIDLSSVLMGPFATMFLADKGADVIKVEAPGGDITRNVGRSPGHGMAPVFQHINRNKRSIVLDLKSKRGKAILLDLVKDADVVVYNMRRAAMDRLGLGYEALQAINPKLVYCGFAGFGHDGPYSDRPAYDDVIQGLVGIPDLMHRGSGAEPRYAPLAIADRIVSLYGLNAIMMALFEQRNIGRGVAIEIPMFESMAHFVLVEHMFYRSFDPPLGQSVSPRPVDLNRRPYQTADGYICVLPYTDLHWQRLFIAICREELIADQLYCSFERRIENVQSLYRILSDALLERSTGDWLAVFDKVDVPAGRMNSIDDLIDDPHLNSVNFFKPVIDDLGSCFIHIDVPIGDGSAAEAKLRPAPRKGQHSAQVLGELGLSEADQATLFAENISQDDPDRTRSSIEPKLG
jgi:crotonobetainyl-CoA:carnitine CoA-transferase CaiB-like acyl-CoA transferase